MPDQLLESEFRSLEFTDYLEALDFGLCIMGADLTLVFANRNFCRLLDYPDELRRPGTSLLDIVRFDCARGLYGDTEPEAAFAMLRSEVRSVPRSANEMRLPGGRIVEFRRRTADDGASVCTVFNVTGNRSAAEALERDAAIIRHLSDAVAVSDLDRRIVYHNPAFARLFSLKPAQCKGRPIPPLDLDSSVDADALVGRLEAGITERGRFEFEFEFSRNGDKAVAHAVVAPRRDRLADQGGYMVLYRDVTEQARDRIRLERQDRILAQLSESVILADPQCHILDCNRATERLFGYGIEELRGRRILDVCGTPRRPTDPSTESIAARILSGKEWRGTISMWTKSGAQRLIECNVQPFYDEGGALDGIIGLHRDVTERRQADDALRRQALIIEHMREAAIVTDRRGTVLEFNASANRMFGLGNKSGVTTELEAQLREVAAEVVEHGHFEGSYVLKGENGAELVCDSVAVAVSGRGDSVERVVSVHRDITDRVRQEREQARLESQVRRWKRLESLGQIAGGIAHDFNNVLTPILGYAHLAKDSIPEDSRAQRDLGRVIAGMEKARDLVRQILTFGQRVDPTRKPVLFDRTVASTLDLLAQALPSGIRLVCEFNCPGVAVSGDGALLHQLVMNLCTNAAQAMPDGGRLLVRTDAAGDWELVRREHRLEGDKHVRLIVEDQGHGIDNEHLERIFDPFFTTKSRDEGTGLGLSVVHGVVRAHGGAIRVCSAQRQGTRFEIFLPACESVAEIADDTGDAPLLSGGGERILVVDDDSEVLEMIERMLTRIGYRALRASSGEQALRLVRTADLPVDLVLTDLMMPEMDGEALSRALRRLRPDLPIVIMSAMLDRRLLKDYAEWSVEALLYKPVVPEELHRTVASALASGREKRFGRSGR